ncbi:hypothetical protein PanWU01x14_326030, partial [Parasponia andersonii]
MPLKEPKHATLPPVIIRPQRASVELHHASRKTMPPVLCCQEPLFTRSVIFKLREFEFPASFWVVSSHVLGLVGFILSREIYKCLFRNSILPKSKEVIV